MLLDIAYMTVGGYPQRVPPEFLIKGLDADTSFKVKPFVDVAINGIEYKEPIRYWHLRIYKQGRI